MTEPYRNRMRAARQRAGRTVADRDSYAGKREQAAQQAEAQRVQFTTKPKTEGK